MMHDIAGTVTSAAGGIVTAGGNRGSSLGDSKRMRTAGQTGGKMKVDIEMDSDILGGGVDSEAFTGEQEINRVRIGRNSILVPGGRTNPFFSKQSRVLTPEEFEKWKKLYKESLIHSGQKSLLTKRYPGISL
jgi:hypothetical protein